MLLQALTRALTSATFDDVRTTELASSLAAGGAGATVGTGLAGSRTRFGLARLWATNPWVRLAGDVIAAREAAASWFLLKPTRSSARRRIASARTWEKDALVIAAIEAGDFEEINDHPFLEMMAAGTQGAPPWIELPGYEVDKLERIVLDLLGSFAYVLFRDPSLGHPVRWWPVSPLWLVPPRPGLPFFTIGAFDYPPEEIAWYRQPRPDDFYGPGSGVAGALDHQIQTNESAAQYQTALYRNMMGRGLLILAPGLGKDEEERFQASWRAHSGPRHAGYTHFVGYPPLQPGAAGGAGIMVKDLAHSPADVQVEDGQKNRRDEILQVWRVPPAIIGQTESSNRATAREAESFVRTNRVTPDLEARRNWLQVRFFEPRPPNNRPEYEGDWIVGYRLPPLDPEDDRIELMKTEPRGFFENDVRIAAGLKPIDGGDERYFLEEVESRAAARVSPMAR